MSRSDIEIRHYYTLSDNTVLEDVPVFDGYTEITLPINTRNITIRNYETDQVIRSKSMSDNTIVIYACDVCCYIDGIYAPFLLLDPNRESGQFRELFIYEHEYQEHIMCDHMFYDCTFLVDFYDFKAGDQVEQITMDWKNGNFTIKAYGRRTQLYSPR